MQIISHPSHCTFLQLLSKTEVCFMLCSKAIVLGGVWSVLWIRQPIKNTVTPMGFTLYSKRILCFWTGFLFFALCGADILQYFLPGPFLCKFFTASIFLFTFNYEDYLAFEERAVTYLLKISATTNPWATLAAEVLEKGIDSFLSLHTDFAIKWKSSKFVYFLYPFSCLSTQLDLCRRFNCILFCCYQ